MRGYIYEITTNPDYIEGMTESQFYDYTPHIGTYIQDVSDKGEAITERFCNDLIKDGFKIRKQNVAIKRIELSSSSIRRKYFRNRYNILKEKMKRLSLNTFANDAHEIFTLKNIMDNDLSDMVYLDGELCTVDKFIRQMEIRTPYFINTRVVMMIG